MKNDYLKYIFYFSSALLLSFMVLASRKAGISCDEILHYNQSESVFRYFESHGADRSALNTPVSHLKYYGQSFDNIVTFLTRWFRIDDVYGFRSLMSSVAGWLVVLLTALFAISLSGYTSGILVILLFSLSPTFLGHSMNNLKDIPFALSYISAVFFITRYLVTGEKIAIRGMILITLSIAFSISIRAGGLVLICYLFFYYSVLLFLNYLKTRKFELRFEFGRFLQITGISIAGWFLGTLLWPFALQNPVGNVIESYEVMAHFPSTFRQLFEGRNEWSDFMPWYYLPKSMAITIPLTVLAGLMLFLFLAKSVMKDKNLKSYGMVIFTILFPLVFVITEKSNLYSSWRQFLFLYPGIILISASGFNYVLERIRVTWLKFAFAACFFLPAIHPVMFMSKSMTYSYMYYNQLVGGLKGAYGDYETDYYYISHKEASEWLIKYLEREKNTTPKIVGATYSVSWLFRKNPEIETTVFRNEERSQHDWDYAIITNRYITPYKLKSGLWPPRNAIHTVFADGVAVCAVLERKTKEDYYGYTALREGRNSDAINFYEKALKTDSSDELIFYNFGLALYNDKQYLRADSVLKTAIAINPDFESGLMYLGNIASYRNKADEAIMYYKRVIKANRKYYEAYAGLADAYRTSDPELARKYDELANSIR